MRKNVQQTCEIISHRTCKSTFSDIFDNLHLSKLRLFDVFEYELLKPDQIRLRKRYSYHILEWSARKKFGSDEMSRHQKVNH